METTNCKWHVGVVEEVVEAMSVVNDHPESQEKNWLCSVLCNVLSFSLMESFLTDDTETEKWE